MSVLLWVYDQLPDDGISLLIRNSVVELTVGVMCSSLPAFAGFLRYHLPLLRSIRTRLSSPFRSFRFSKLLDRRSDRGSSEKNTSRIMKVTLGSRVNGKGHFMTLPTHLEKGVERSAVTQTRFNTPQSFNPSHATRRHYYEEVGSRHQSPVIYPAPVHSSPSGTDTITAMGTENEICGQAPAIYHNNTRRTSWWRLPWRSSITKGYWDVISLFQSRAPDDADENRKLQLTSAS